MKPSPRRLETVAQAFAWLLNRGIEQNVWVTVTFPEDTKGDSARQKAFSSWVRRHKEDSKSAFVPERHKSGELHFHGVMWWTGRNFNEGFDFEARKAWQRSGEAAARNAWMGSRSPDLIAIADRLRETEGTSVGFVDVVPLEPSTRAMAVARYCAKYAAQAGLRKGMRIVRKIGWTRDEVDRPPRPSDFSFAGDRARLFGAMKQEGDVGWRGKGWALIAAGRGLWRVAARPSRPEDEKIASVARHVFGTLTKGKVDKDKLWQNRGMTELEYWVAVSKSLDKHYFERFGPGPGGRTVEPKAKAVTHSIQPQLVDATPWLELVKAMGVGV